MKSFVAIAMLFCLLLIWHSGGAMAGSTKLPPIVGEELLYGKTPDKNAKDWIRLILLTPRNGPSPIFFISPTTFHVEEPQILFHLSKRDYKLFDDYTYANRCNHTSGDYLPPQVLEASEHTDANTRVVCRLTQPATCRYLNGISKISNVDWANKKWEPLRRLNGFLGCV
jgi:hypothetical protein